MKVNRVACAIAALFAVSVLTLLGAPAKGRVAFVPHDVAQVRGGYAVDVADFNKDGKMDIIANSLQVQEVAWYENPTWERHVIAPEMRSIVNQAMADIDGDGIPEVAFQSSFAMQAANSAGDVWIARHQGDPRQPWKVTKIDSFPTSHHILWIDLDGDGKKELANAPLIGEKSLAPTYDQDKAPVFWYDTKEWKRHTVTGDVPGIIHRVRAVSWDNNRRQQLLVASFEGVVLYRATGSGDGMQFEKQVLTTGHDTEKAPRLGASDIGTGNQDGKRFFGTVEPWHGNEVVTYAENAGKWTRRVIYDKVASGHEILVVDLNGDGRDDIVANDNSNPGPRNPNAAPGGVHVFYAPDNLATGEWKYQRLDDKSAMNGCVTADINGDKRADIICNGAGSNLRWYENTGAAAQ